MDASMTALAPLRRRPLRAVLPDVLKFDIKTYPSEMLPMIADKPDYDPGQAGCDPWGL
jgi:hypothetical protein